jgi:hypothetical protein
VHAKTDLLGIGVIGRNHLRKDKKINMRVRFGKTWCDIKITATATSSHLAQMSNTISNAIL